ncbi:MAG: OmpA family protein [Dysgonamonadaceae bacterium]|jgi:outer membrane protein OmpA-like peptidoglycan-associated protein|nr:OmpA family protein [Dysgonamonadaceae bacterium]MDD4399475.1 OmpA family protein [Dysgonamonadaceae bacterium]MEA5080143.1 OmpA family protein [Dysgonamonadaceae bacterium]
MKHFNGLAVLLLSGALIFSGCGASRTVKGTGIGAGAGAAIGAGVGAIAGGGKGAAIGAGIGTVIGGAAGALIGKKMDKQAAELEKIEGAQVEKVNEGEAIKVTFDSGILFATNSSTLNTASRDALDNFATSLKNNAETNIEIFGHTDSSGSDAINNPLSERRAESVYNYLISKGIAGTRMHSKGFGSTQPVADNSTSAGKAQNRRVEVFILPNAKMIEEAQQQTK